jgi:hypothetical protein
MWQRWNGTSKIFEKSTDNGASWSALDLDAAIITQGALAKARQHAQTAYKDAANVFSVAGQEFAEIVLTDKGLRFPATQVASAGANDLDDYEEGTFTPTLIGSTSGAAGSYTAQVGHYVKIGKFVYFQCRVTISSVGTITGSVEIGGLPFTTHNVANGYGAATVAFWANLAVNVYSVTAYIIPNTTVLLLNAQTAAVATASSMTSAQITATSDFIVSGWYTSAG